MNSCFSSTCCLAKELIVISTAYFFRKIASHANVKALVPQNERRTPIEDVLARVLEEHVAVNVRVDPW